jgi:molecular chaperone GrpE (heat shock protein)
VEPERAEQVLEELVVGYTFKGRVIRPTRVKVGVAADAE